MQSGGNAKKKTLLHCTLHTTPTPSRGLLYPPVMSLRILVVDDEETIRRSLRLMLSARGYDVAVAHDRASARYSARQRDPDHAIVDQRLGHLAGDRSGLDVADELLADYPRLRVLIHTGYPAIDAAFSAGRRTRIVGYLEKPATIDEICAKLEGRTLTPLPRTATLEQVGRAHISRVLADHGGNVTRAAAALGISPETLRRKLAC